MALKIMPHGRLQEWVAEEKGYFAAEGLEYSFVHRRRLRHPPAAQRDDAGRDQDRRLRDLRGGPRRRQRELRLPLGHQRRRERGTGQLVTTAYSVAPCAIMVPPESPVRRPEDLAGVPVGVGYHSGSHFATLQALEPVLPADQISLTFQGPPNERLDALLDRQVPAGDGVGRAAVHRRGLRVPQGRRRHVHDRLPGDRADVSHDRRGEVPGRAAARPDGHRPAARAVQALPPAGRPGEVPRPGRRAGVRHRASGSCSCPYTREVFTATQQWTQDRKLFPESRLRRSATTRPRWSSRPGRPAGPRTQTPAPAGRARRGPRPRQTRPPAASPRSPRGTGTAAWSPRSARCRRPRTGRSSGTSPGPRGPA